MNVRGVLTVLVLAILAVVMPSSASASASVIAAPETRIGNFELRTPALIGFFAVTRTVENHRAKSILCADLASQHSLRWKGMWRYDLGGGVEVYDARARMWSPKLGTFLSVDEFTFHNSTTTLWGWPGQSPSRWSDPDGRCGAACVGAVTGGVLGGLYYAATASTSMSWGDFAIGAAGAIGEGALVGGIAGANPQLGFVLIGGLGVASDKDLWKLGLAAPLATAGGGNSCPSRGGSAEPPAGAGGEPKALPPHTPAKPPVSSPESGTFYVDPKGNVVPTPPGGRITGSPDGRFIQARDAAGDPTGIRIDGPHSPNSHADPRAQVPHGHGVVTSDPDDMMRLDPTLRVVRI